tara:strand:- start:270 stop:1025 length:756 start_codon:yes stop_codon:yes gene_type:complete
MRKKIIAGNWKMNLDKNDSTNLTSKILKNTEQEKDKKIILSPPFIYLEQLVTDCSERKDILIAAQNCSENGNGAYTGEVSAQMIKSIGVDYVIIGHSERRQYFNESHEVLSNKLSQALSNNLKVIFCCGENINQRDNNEFLDVIYNQLSSTVFNLSAVDFSKIIIAYEPIWAIGTGKNATSEQAQEMHNYIRTIVSEKYGNEAANNVSILYGGSCKPSNAKSIFSQIDIDGGLIGGASLKSDDFISIINSI